MGDTTTEENTALPAINLYAGSYRLEDLEAASKHAGSLKSDANQAKALASIPADQLVDKDAFAGRGVIPAPEGTEIGEVEDSNGRTVTAPVPIPEEPEVGEQPNKPERRGKQPAAVTSTSGSEPS